MLEYGVVPDNFTFPFVLKDCANVGDVGVGRDVHDHVVKTGWDKDVFVCAGVIDMYAKCREVGKAREVFGKVVEWEVVIWNAMMAGYGQNLCAPECLGLCGEMAWSGVRQTVATLVTAISSCADMSDLVPGR
ncbi:tetratricopeptide-like helical domain, DYW domain protein [Artemisia annua]|uniref:Tetratricopeptide-like helical domain, DYW domain protein n=1 Tax=Artemisia annua TaxID=35608 RepID=A0A2U1NV22_ARTAN|nr:tetratricopeptide-like helical domain, DYW domain protein [Artemisia annua]